MWSSQKIYILLCFAKNSNFNRSWKYLNSFETAFSGRCSLLGDVLWALSRHWVTLKCPLHSHPRGKWVGQNVRFSIHPRAAQNHPEPQTEDCKNHFTNNIHLSTFQKCQLLSGRKWKDQRTGHPRRTDAQVLSSATQGRGSWSCPGF